MSKNYSKLTLFISRSSISAFCTLSSPRAKRVDPKGLRPESARAVTVLTVDNLKAVSEAFFAANDADVAMTMADRMEYITEMMTDMTNLIQNTNKQIKEANEIYAESALQTSERG